MLFFRSKFQNKSHLDKAQKSSAISPKTRPMLEACHCAFPVFAAFDLLWNGDWTCQTFLRCRCLFPSRPLTEEQNTTAESSGTPSKGLCGKKKCCSNETVSSWWKQMGDDAVRRGESFCRSFRLLVQSRVCWTKPQSVKQQLLSNKPREFPINHLTLSLHSCWGNMPSKVAPPN